MANRGSGSSRRVAGVDGCRGGWLVATTDERGGGVVDVVASIGPLIDAACSGEFAAVAIDMPIGLPDVGPRACDVAARQRLGPRRASVFPAPVRGVLGARTYAEACARSASACGKRLSRQTFHLLPGIADLDSAMTPTAQRRVREAHPELAFAQLVGRPMPDTKRSPSGRAARIAALNAAGIEVPLLRPSGAAADDVLDALVLITVARRIAAGVAEHIGDGTCDARGLRMEIAA